MILMALAADPTFALLLLVSNCVAARRNESPVVHLGAIPRSARSSSLFCRYTLCSSLATASVMVVSDSSLVFSIYSILSTLQYNSSTWYPWNILFQLFSLQLILVLAYTFWHFPITSKSHFQTSKFLFTTLGLPCHSGLAYFINSLAVSDIGQFVILIPNFIFLFLILFFCIYNLFFERVGLVVLCSFF